MQTPNMNELHLNQFVPYRMVNLATSMSMALSKIYKNEFDLTIAQWRVLAQLGEQQSLYAKDIGEITAMDKSKVSRAAKSLEDKGFLNRQIDEKDNRAAYLSLTEKGKTIYKQIVPKALDWERQLLSVLGSNESENFKKILDRLEQHITLLNRE